MGNKISFVDLDDNDKIPNLSQTQCVNSILKRSFVGNKRYLPNANGLQDQKNMNTSSPNIRHNSLNNLGPKKILLC